MHNMFGILGLIAKLVKYLKIFTTPKSFWSALMVSIAILEHLYLIRNLHIVSGSCYLDKALNVEIDVKYRKDFCCCVSLMLV